MQFSVLMSVYKNDVWEHITLAVESIINQSAPPAEVVIVIDGPIPTDSEDGLFALKERYPIVKLLPLEQNVGLGEALRIGLNHCSYDIVARMDSDDISVPDRFARQLECFEADSELSIVGSDITEFILAPDKAVSVREVPKSDAEIKKYMRDRCAMNHMTVMFKKSEVLRAGGYRHYYYNEDSYLWIRMMAAGCKFGNIKQSLVYVRINDATFMRRGGWRYFLSEKGLLDLMFKNNMIGRSRYLYNLSVRFVIQVLMPNRLRKFIFLKLMRKKPKPLT